MSTLSQVCEVIANILDLDPSEIQPETYLVRDLHAESIDFLELGVAINAAFHVEVSDETLFLTNLRAHLQEATRLGKSPVTHLRNLYPALSEQRLAAIVSDLPKGPSIQVQDLVSYVDYQRARA